MREKLPGQIERPVHRVQVLGAGRLVPLPRHRDSPEYRLKVTLAVPGRAPLDAIGACHVDALVLVGAKRWPDLAAWNQDVAILALQTPAGADVLGSMGALPSDHRLLDTALFAGASDGATPTLRMPRNYSFATKTTSPAGLPGARKALCCLRKSLDA